jgi:5,5'-dehydrodivanillate O-demethylase
MASTTNPQSAVRDTLSDDWADVYHVGPGTLAGRYLRSFWQPVYVARGLAPGSAKPIRIMSETFTLYRGESGTPHLVAFRCAHRRTQLSIGWVEGDTIRCRYHGWVYDASGQCVEQPGEPEPFCERIKIRGYPTQEYLGLIFAYLGEGEPPPLPRYPDFEAEGYLDAWMQSHDCSYFNALDNDPIHVSFVHRTPGRDWHEWNGEAPIVWGLETDYGMEQWIRRPGGREDFIYCCMPNISYRPVKDYREPADIGPTDHLQWRVPVDDEHHNVYSAYKVHLSEEEVRQRKLARDPDQIEEGLSVIAMAHDVLAGRLDLDDSGLKPGIRLTQLQDEATQVGQERIPDLRGEHLGRSDASVVFFRRLWAREMRALADGRPIKRWVPPQRPTTRHPGEG